jgi:hypothetical protein
VRRNMAATRLAGNREPVPVAEPSTQAAAVKAANNVKQETILFFIIVGGLALFSALQLFLATEVQENASDSDLFKLKARVIQWVRLVLARDISISVLNYPPYSSW